jgi:hypothetical protein
MGMAFTWLLQGGALLSIVLAVAVLRERWSRTRSFVMLFPGGAAIAAYLALESLPRHRPDGCRPIVGGPVGHWCLQRHCRFLGGLHCHVCHWPVPAESGHRTTCAVIQHLSALTPVASDHRSVA